MTAVLAVLSVPTDLPRWLRLAAQVETLFGEPLSSSRSWHAWITRKIDGQRAWCVRGTDPEILGGMALSLSDPGTLTIAWLAVDPPLRRRGIGRTLVVKALELAAERPVRVVTFGPGHPGGAEADAARDLYTSCGFRLTSEDPGEVPDHTPRVVLRHEKA